MRQQAGAGCIGLGHKLQRIVSAAPDALALRYPDGRSLSHTELYRLVCRMATGLLARGVKARQVVALVNRKSPEGLATMLACNKLGVLYTNIDPESPPERAQRILERCKPVLILVDDSSSAPYGPTLGEFHGIAFTMSETIAAQADDDALARHDHEAAITGTDGAYIMFTSGSTGFPKGAVMTQENVLRFVEWGARELRVGPGDVLTNVNPIYFDNSVFDLYVSLYNGAALCPFTPEQVKDARGLVRMVDAAQCTFWFSVPSMLVYLLTMRALERGSFKHMRAIMFGGEGFAKARLKELHGLLGDRVELRNAYGPTECTCICSAYPITASDFTDMENLAPLGHLSPGFYPVIDALDPAQPDFGELLLGGSHVGSGYFNDAERTSASFVQDPTEPNYRKIVYRTGDLVQRDAQGMLHFKGRRDNQIKHMGYRIELEEIESAFNALDVVQEAGVVYHRDQLGTGSIQAFVRAAGPLEEDQLRSSLSKRLPTYMMPRRIHFMDMLPKNQNGKIDRQQLKALCT
jgi:D-alanine--poly(phosphoribitol) ligase subunit 1